MNKGSQRLFIAIRLPEGLRAALGQKCRRMASELEFSKWVHADDYHITVQFLGDTSVEKIPALIEALKGAVAGFAPFELSLQQWGTFGPPSSPRVLWEGIAGDLVSLHELHKAVTVATLPLGFEGEERKYSPHITLARKYRGEHPYNPERLKALLNAQPDTEEASGDIPWIVDSMVLFVTNMHKSPMYEVVENITFS